MIKDEDSIGKLKPQIALRFRLIPTPAGGGGIGTRSLLLSLAGSMQSVDGCLPVSALRLLPAE